MSKPPTRNRRPRNRQRKKAPRRSEQLPSPDATRYVSGVALMGAPGTGKSQFLEHLVQLQIGRGGALLLIDPHGDLHEDIMRYVRTRR